MSLRPSSQILIGELGTDFIDAKLKELSYDHSSNIVHLKYGDINNNANDKSITFRGCFSVSINKWLEGVEGVIPQKSDEMDFFFQEILIEDVVINAIQLYKCSMLIPMMDCRITCISIELN
ncbi:hypothetical protein [Paenibacillus aestuarii]|uniref:hypothetical protein n=1 Tax=Paenibacillus aestuarii TaxID=516965 RepID=UPI0022E9CD38|nr:hypothetical protein [Paenibacillus aestuarii]